MVKHDESPQVASVTPASRDNLSDSNARARIRYIAEPRMMRKRKREKKKKERKKMSNCIRNLFEHLFKRRAIMNRN